MSMLSKIARGKTSMPPRLLTYGIEGVGKTTFAAQSPAPIVIQCEDGLGELDVARFPLATSLNDVQLALADLHREEHDFQTVVIDSVDWLERLIFDQICAEYGVTSIEQAGGGFGKGYVLSLTHWREIIRLLDALRTDCHMLVILIAHAKVERFEDPESLRYDRYCPRLHKHAAALLCEWSDAVLFATRKMRTQSDDTGFNRKRTIAHAIGKAGGDRVLRCVGGPSCVAKNRYGITDELPLSWAAFMQALHVAIQEN